MEIVIIYALAFLFVITVVVTLIGHGIWLMVAAIIRQFRGHSKAEPTAIELLCPNCNSRMGEQAVACFRCGLVKPSEITAELLRDLSATTRQIVRFHRSGAIDDSVFELLSIKLDAEKSLLLNRSGVSDARTAATVEPPRVHSVVEHHDESVTGNGSPESVSIPASVIQAEVEASPVVPVQASITSVIYSESVAHAEITADDPSKTVRSNSKRRKPFTEVIAAFMEESNIRWGEIIGGLLIIGCSTALVVSLWAEISQIPVLKFLIFTTVTAALFGVGLYTEHRWKLPTTSRGILTIATLLVPLNFLAIAAVSSSLPTDLPLIISELVAPAVFLCLVYFAGRVLTPSWPHLLTAGVLGSSAGQLLVRHFAGIENSPAQLIALGAFPIVCYVVSTIWMLRLAITDDEISEQETTSIFITLGAMTFASVLPFGLLLYKSGPVAMSMMYLAPMISLGGLPALAIGTILWRRVIDKKLLAQRTAGTTLALLGTLTVLLGMVLAWPNPASIVPAALLNFAVFTALAIWLRIPVAHFIASICFGFGYIAFFQVIAGHVSWQNLRVTSLLDVSLSASSGQALTLLFVCFLAASEWLLRKGRELDSRAYLSSALLVAFISIFLVIVFGLGIEGDPEGASVIFAVYAAGALWIAARRKQLSFSWIGSALLFAAIAQACARWFEVAFPWQTAFLVYGTLCAVLAITCSRYSLGLLTKPLNSAALLSSFAVVICLVQAGSWETTDMQAERVFWLSGVWLLLLWLNRSRGLFTIFQVALTCGAALAIKAVLQQYEWYSYLPLAFLHPWSLQIQGTLLILFCLGWTALRLVTKRTTTTKRDQENVSASWLSDAWCLLDAPLAFDRVLTWSVLGGFVLLSFYGAWSGIAQELTAAASESKVWNIAGFPHELAIGLGSWIVLGLIVLVMMFNFRERSRKIYALGAAAALTTAIPLLAGRWESEVATASAWRWIAALFLIFVSIPLWYRKRLVEYFNLSNSDPFSNKVRDVILLCTLVPLIILTAYPALRALYYLPVRGPLSGVFALLNNELLYGLPLLLAAFALIVYAVRQALPGFALLGGLLINLAATIVYLFSVVAVNGSMDRVVLVHVLQLNAIVFALYALTWLATRKRWLGRLDAEGAIEARRTIAIQMALCVATNLIVVVPVTMKLVARPELAGIGTFEAGNLRGWLAFVFTIVAAAWFARAHSKELTPGHLFAALMGGSCLLSFAAARWDVVNWSGYHTFIVSTALSAIFMLLLGLRPRPAVQAWFDRVGLRLSSDWRRNCALFATLGGLFAAFLSVRALPGEPANAWWSIAPLLAITALSAALHWQTLNRAYLYAAGILFSGAALIWWTTQFNNRGGNLRIIIIALCTSGVAWLVFELRARRVSQQCKHQAFSFHNVVSIGSLIVIGLAVLARLASYILLDLTMRLAWLDALSLASVVALLLACLWDKGTRHTVPSLYVAGLLTIGLGLVQLELLARHLVWALVIGMAFFSLATAFAWRSRQQVLRFLDRLKIPRRIDLTITELKWLSAFNLAVACAIALMTFGIVLAFPEQPLRLAAAVAVTFQVVTFAVMADGVQKNTLRGIAITMFCVGLVMFGWGWLTPATTGTWLNRAVIMMVELFALTAVYSLVLQKGLERQPEWTKSLRACIPWILGAGAVALIFTLTTEVVYQINFGAVRINSISLIAIALTLISAIFVLVLFAMSPRHDPLGFSESGRMKYVYAAEIVLAFLFMHVRLSMPWLFSGFFDDYWPLVVIVIAYLGVVSSEALRRRNLLVLARPIERTGAFLPLLPVIGFWVAQSRVDYSLLLFLVGSVYAGLSILRRSFAFGLLAAVAGNGGLWYLLHRTQNYGFAQHPQLWLIPVALSILVAAYLNRDQFSEEQMTGVRYFSLMMIYASSTADIFVNGVVDSPWLPLILAALSLGGIFAGISLRIRGLLLMGSVFLFFAVVTMIYYASVNLGWTWLWYVAGIVTGATIIFMFAVFEKKRGEVLRMVDGLKEWST